MACGARTASARRWSRHPTKWMTNAKEIAVRLDRKCVSEKSEEKHRHCDLMKLDKKGVRVIERYPVA